MGMDISKFEEIKNKARKLIHEDAKKDAHIIKERIADRNSSKFFSDQPNDIYSNVTSSSLNESYDNSTDRLNNAIDEKMNQYLQNKNTQPSPMTKQMISQSKLPKEILESFSKNYIDQEMPILDEMGVTRDNLQEQQTSYPSQQKTQPGGAKIDYEMIKAIVESSVKKYVSALGKKMLNESKSSVNLDEINAIQITDKKIAIVTKNGNLFEGKLNFIKNIKGES